MSEDVAAPATLRIRRRIGIRRAILTAATAFAAAASIGAAAGTENGGADRASAAPNPAHAAAGGGRGVRKKLVARFSSPVHVAAARGIAATYVVEQDGRVMVLRNGRKRRRPFLDIRGRVRSGGEEGLLSIAFHPDFRRNRRAYLFFTNNSGNLVIAEVRARRRNALIARRGTLRKVLAIPHRGASNHNGGQLAFGPGKLLFIGTGDGGGARDPDNSAQRRDTLLGKILRINPLPRRGRPFTVPGSNPFVRKQGKKAIYALGLRNPHRFSFDWIRGKRTRIAIGDVGQDRFEEINYRTVGAARNANFGWNDYEGFSRTSYGTPPLTPRHHRPILAYALTGGRCAVIGGFVLRNRRIPGLRGRYVYGDFCTGAIRSFVPRNGRARRDRSAGITISLLSSFGLGRGGVLYATSLDGAVYRLVRA